MAKAKSIDQLVDEQVAVLDAQSLAGSKGFGLPSWLPLPEWLIAQAIAIVFSLLKGLAKTDSAKATFRSVVLRIFNAIKVAYAGDPEFE